MIAQLSRRRMVACKMKRPFNVGQLKWQCLFIICFLQEIRCDQTRKTSKSSSLVATATATDEEIPFDSDSSNKPLHLNAVNQLAQHNSFIVDPFGATFDEFLRDSQQQQQSLVPVEPQADQANPSENRHLLHNHNAANDNNNNNNRNEDGAIGQLFAWKVLPTSKCSRVCGRGLRINHISCVDKKYDVRVEDQLCSLKANEKRPSELSQDEPCNEFDCPISWHSLSADSMGQFELGQQLKSCSPNNSNNHNNNCACIQLLANGSWQKLDDSKCQLTNKHSTDNNNNNNNNNLHEELINFEPQSESMDHLAVSLDDINLNNIMQSTDSVDQLTATSSPKTHSITSKGAANEPFYEPLPWKECKLRDQEPDIISSTTTTTINNKCGLLGVRTRELKCKMFLSRSNKLVELPLDSCDQAISMSLIKPDIEEPCYLDCKPELSNNNNNNETLHDLSSKQIQYPQIQLADETVYDLEMTRYEWRQDNWSKCNSDCLGGERELLVECWDKLLDSPVELQLCDLESKPKSRIEKCNEFACPVEWRFEPYGECSRQCGSEGIRPRHLVCVQKTKIQNNNNTTTTTATTTTNDSDQLLTITMSWPQEINDNKDDNDDNYAISKQHDSIYETQGSFHYRIVPLELCSSNVVAAGPEPAKFEACNRINCPPQWVNGPWSECNTQCGPGLRQRNVSCVQELADKIATINYAIMPNNHPLSGGQFIGQSGHIIQIPFERCYSQYKMVPNLEESCYGSCLNQPFIDSHKTQDFELPISSLLGRERKSISLRIGGKARLFEGQSLKLRCKIMKRIGHEQHQQQQHSARTVKRLFVPIEWRFDGQLMFPNGTLTSDKRFVVAQEQNQHTHHLDKTFDDDSFENDLQFGTQAALMQADQPAQQQPEAINHRQSIIQTKNGQKLRKQRNLSVRSWNVINAQQQDNNNHLQAQFVPDSEGRFSLSRENTLKIKRLKREDSGRYRCSYGNLSETLDLYVTSPSLDNRIQNNIIYNKQQQLQQQIVTSQDKARAENELIN